MKTVGKRLLALAVVCAVLAPAAFAETKIAVVDSKRIRSEFKQLVEERKKAEELFKLEQKELDERYQAMLESIRKLQEKYRAGEITEEAYQQERNKLQLSRNDLIQQREIKQKRWDEHVEAQLEPLLLAIQDTVKKIGAEQGYAVVLNSRYVEYWSPAVDVTDAVLRELNAKPIQPAPPAAKAGGGNAAAESKSAPSPSGKKAR